MFLANFPSERRALRAVSIPYTAVAAVCLCVRLHRPHRDLWPGVRTMSWCRGCATSLWTDISVAALLTSHPLTLQLLIVDTSGASAPANISIAFTFHSSTYISLGLIAPLMTFDQFKWQPSFSQCLHTNWQFSYPSGSDMKPSFVTLWAI